MESARSRRAGMALVGDPAGIAQLAPGPRQAAFRARFKRTAIARTKRRGLVRNAALAAGNRRDSSATAALRRLAADGDSVVRRAAEWALQRLAQV